MLNGDSPRSCVWIMFCGLSFPEKNDHLMTGYDTGLQETNFLWSGGAGWPHKAIMLINQMHIKY